MPAKESPPTRRRRWLWALIALVLLVVAGPTLLSYTSVPASVLASQIPAEAGRLAVGSVRLGWLGPIEVTGVQLDDPAGEPLASVERITVKGGLIGLASGEAAPLAVTVDRPRVDLVVGPGGSNFDALIAALDAKRDPSSAEEDAPFEGGSRPTYVLVNDAALRVTDASSGAQWAMEGLNVRLEDPGRGVNAIEATIEGTLQRLVGADEPPEPKGQVNLRLGDAKSGGRLAELKADALPLSLVAPWLHRVDPTAELTGRVSVEGQAAWRTEGMAAPPSNRPADVLRALAAGGVRATGVTRLRDVSFSGAATDGAVTRFGDVAAPWSVTTDNERLVLEEFAITADAGRIAATGSVDALEIERWSGGDAVAPRDLRLEGEIDLGRLAEAAPQLVRLQAGARVDSGRIEFAASCLDQRVTASVLSGPLSGVSGGRQVTWREPLDLQLTATQIDAGEGLAGWGLESFDARSSFFNATAAGDAQSVAGELRFDLGRLAAELEALFELGAVRLAGTGAADVEFDRNDATGRWRLTADGRVDNLFVGSTEAPYANEPNFNFRTDLTGRVDGGEAPSGVVTLLAGDDELTVDLAATDADDQPFEVTLSGDAARWWRRAAVAGELPSPEQVGLSGQIDATATGVTRGRSGRLDQFRVGLTGLGLDTAPLGGARVRLREERIEASGRATWDLTPGSFNLIEGQVASSVASARLRDVTLSTADPEATRGEAVARLDLGQLARWLPPREGPQQYVASGVIDAGIAAEGVPGGMALKMNLNGAQLALTDRQAGAQAVWSEPKLVAQTDLSVVRARDDRHTITLREMTVSSDSINGSARGQIRDAVAMTGVELSGEVDYDLAKLTPMLWPRLGDGVRLVGRDQARFRVETDPEAPADAPAIARVRARVEAPWEGADLFGLPVGPGRFGVTLQRGVARVDPLDVVIGQGRLTAGPTATLLPAPGRLTLQPGPLATDVAVSREVTDRFLKFIAPVLADAARIEGRFSVALAEFDVPLERRPGDPADGVVAGFLDIARVRVTPGPTVEQWISVVRQIEGVASDGVGAATRPRDTVLVAIDDSRVDFRFVNGRVYHQGLAFYVGDARVESAGSVGVDDETLDLVLTVPILEEWIQKQPQFLTRLRGQSIRIPVRGTFSRPQVDSEQFRRLSRQLLENAAVGAIEGGLNRLFERLQSR